MIPNLQLPIDEWANVVEALPDAGRCVICKHVCYCVKPYKLDVHRLYPGGKTSCEPDVSLKLCANCVQSHTLWIMQGNNVCSVTPDTMFVVGKAHWNEP